LAFEKPYGLRTDVRFESGKRALLFDGPNPFDSTELDVALKSPWYSR
jgi:hypothetical protein